MKNSFLQLSDVESSMFEEVFQVMSKYEGKTREFGIQLVHSHFPLNSGEVLYETHDKAKRHIEVRPVNVSSLKKIPLATAWNKTETGKLIVSLLCCDGPEGQAEDF